MNVSGCGAIGGSSIVDDGCRRNEGGGCASIVDDGSLRDKGGGCASIDDDGSLRDKGGGCASIVDDGCRCENAGDTDTVDDGCREGTGSGGGVISMTGELIIPAGPLVGGCGSQKPTVPSKELNSTLNARKIGNPRRNMLDDDASDTIFKRQTSPGLHSNRLRCGIVSCTSLPSRSINDT